MIIIVKRSASEEQIEDLRNELESQGLGTAFAWGENAGVLGVLGDSFRLDADRIRCLEFVESVTRGRRAKPRLKRKIYSRPPVWTGEREYLHPCKTALTAAARGMNSLSDRGGRLQSHTRAEAGGYC